MSRFVSLRKNWTEIELQDEKAPFALRGYPSLIPVYPRAIPSFKFISLVVGIVLFVLVGGGIGNVMAMAVLERKREIGTLRALGMEKNQVRRLFLTEGLILGAAGALTGLLLAGALTQFIAAYGGIHLPPPPGTHQILTIIPQMDSTSSVLGVVMPLLVSVFAAWWPASASANLSPSDALMEA